MMGKRWWIAASLLLAATLALAKLPHGRKVELPQPLSVFPAEFGEWQGFDYVLEPHIIAASGADGYLNRDYVRPGAENVSLYIGFYKSQQTGDLIHSPKNCLPGAGWHPYSSWITDLKLANGRQFPINAYIVQNEREKLLVLYWYQSHGRIIASEYQAKIYMVLDGIQLGRTDSALVRIATKIGDDPDRPYRLALAFAREVAPKLDALIPK